MIEILGGLGAVVFAALGTSPTTPPCEYEDGSELATSGEVCVWNADTTGNDEGMSFVVVRNETHLWYFYEGGDVEVSDAPVSPMDLGPGDDWDGLLVGDVVICPPGFEVSVDTTSDGVTWAGCM